MATKTASATAKARVAKIVEQARARPVPPKKAPRASEYTASMLSMDAKGYAWDEAVEAFRGQTVSLLEIAKTDKGRLGLMLQRAFIDGTLTKLAESASLDWPADEKTSKRVFVRLILSRTHPDSAIVPDVLVNLVALVDRAGRAYAKSQHLKWPVSSAGPVAQPEGTLSNLYARIKRDGVWVAEPMDPRDPQAFFPYIFDRLFETGRETPVKFCGYVYSRIGKDAREMFAQVVAAIGNQFLQDVAKKQTA